MEIREEQIEANKQQAAALNVEAGWLLGDARELESFVGSSPRYDFVFSCPPYYDLEVYSDDPRDLSNLKTYEEFLATYSEIISKSLAVLKENRFACFVVADIRDKKGFYRDFVGDTIRAFEENGALLYNHAILLNQPASLPIRVGQFFPNYRKLGKMHQNILVFFNGNPQMIPSIYPKELSVEARESELE